MRTADWYSSSSGARSANNRSRRSPLELARCGRRLSIKIPGVCTDACPTCSGIYRGITTVWSGCGSGICRYGVSNTFAGGRKARRLGMNFRSLGTCGFERHIPKAWCCSLVVKIRQRPFACSWSQWLLGSSILGGLIV